MVSVDTTYEQTLQLQADPSITKACARNELQALVALERGDRDLVELRVDLARSGQEILLSSSFPGSRTNRFMAAVSVVADVLSGSWITSRQFVFNGDGFQVKSIRTVMPPEIKGWKQIEYRSVESRDLFRSGATALDLVDAAKSIEPINPKDKE